MTDSISMWLSRCDSMDLKEFKRRLEINTAHCTLAWNCTPNGEKKEKKGASFRGFVRFQIIALI